MRGICAGISGGARGLGSHALGSRCLHPEATCEAALAPARPVAMVSGDHVGARAGAGRREGGAVQERREREREELEMLPTLPGLRSLCRRRRTEQPRRGPSAPRSQPVAPGALAQGPRSPRPDRGEGNGARAAPRRPGRAQAG